MRTTLWLLTVGLAAPLAGQQQHLDSTRARYRDALVTVREALTPIGAALQSLRRDLTTAGAPTVLAKTRTLQRACERAQSTLRGQRPVFEGADGNPRRAAAARDLVAAMRMLDTQLGETCLAGLRTGDSVVADTVRTWMPFRARQLRDAERAYTEAAATFARVFEFRLPPPSARGE